jgi:hypothetical protein
MKIKVESISKHLNDFLEFGSNKSVLTAIAQKADIGISVQRIYSDYIARINSLGERKLRYILITEKYIHIFKDGSKDKEYKLKMSIPLYCLDRVVWADNNKSLFVLKVKKVEVIKKETIFDQLLESFRRKKMTIFIRSIVGQ